MKKLNNKRNMYFMRLLCRNMFLHKINISLLHTMRRQGEDAALPAPTQKLPN